MIRKSVHWKFVSLDTTWVLNMYQEKKYYPWQFFNFLAQKCMLNIYWVIRSRFQEIKIGSWEGFEKIEFSHFSSWENDFPVVKSGFWGHISHLLGICLYWEVVLDFPFGHWKCPNWEWGKGHFSKWCDLWYARFMLACWESFDSLILHSVLSIDALWYENS